MRAHVLDANAFYRFVTDGDGAEIVADIFKQAKSATPVEATVMMSVIAWGEVYYTVVRHIGIAKAENLLEEARRRTGIDLVRVETEDAVKAGRLKAQYNIPYADAFSAVLAGTQNIVVTADEEHFSRVPKIRMVKLPRHHRSKRT
jgi:predicted nucleic acid-binding protein